MFVRFHHKSRRYRRITLSDNNTTAETHGWVVGTVFSSVAVNKLHNKRFVFKLDRRREGHRPVCYIGVTRTDPDTLKLVPWYARDVPHTWCIRQDLPVRYENSRCVDTGEVTRVTQQAGDVWCVEVTPGGQVYIYHNYSQPWGSPVFTLPSDTTDTWAAVTLFVSTISVIQEPSKEVSAVKAILPRVSRDATVTLIQQLGSAQIDEIVTDLVKKCNTADYSDYDIITSIIRKTGDPVRIFEVCIGEALRWNISENSILDLLKNSFIKEEKPVVSKPGFLLLILTKVRHFILTNKETPNTNRSRVDTKLYSIVKALLSAETQESIDMKDEDGFTCLHIAVQLQLVLVTKLLLSYPDIDVNSENGKDQTALMLHVQQNPPVTGDINSILSLFLHHPRIKPDTHSIEYLFREISKSADPSGLLALYKGTILAMCQQPDCSPDILTTIASSLKDCPPSETATAIKIVILKHVNLEQNVFTDLVLHIIRELEQVEEDTSYRRDTASNILEHLKDTCINNPIFPGRKTLAHKCAELKYTRFLDSMLPVDEFDPNVQDDEGNTILFYMSDLQPTQFLTYIRHTSAEWNFRIQNKRRQNVLDFYAGRPNKIETIWKELSDLTLSPAPASDPSSTGIDLPERNVTIVPAPHVPANYRVKCSTQRDLRHISDKIKNGLVYNLQKEKKGKVVIIALPHYYSSLSSRFCDLTEYENDTKNITDVFTQIGFEVFIPQPDTTNGNHCLTAKEIRKSVHLFSASLTQEDPCAVLVILAHGGQGFIYGSDGKIVVLDPLLQNLNNVKCPQMRGKPKFIIIQACQGGERDAGVRAAAEGFGGPQNLPEARLLPSICDFIITFPAWPGFQAFVKDGQSIYIRYLLRRLADSAATEDLNTILTKVNYDVARERILYQGLDNKQTSRFENSLTRLLYFWPGLEVSRHRAISF